MTGRKIDIHVDTCVNDDVYMSIIEQMRVREVTKLRAYFERREPVPYDKEDRYHSSEFYSVEVVPIVEGYVLNSDDELEINRAVRNLDSNIGAYIDCVDWIDHARIKRKHKPFFKQHSDAIYSTLVGTVTDRDIKLRLKHIAKIRVAKIICESLYDD